MGGAVFKVTSSETSGAALNMLWGSTHFVNLSQRSRGDLLRKSSPEMVGESGFGLGEALAVGVVRSCCRSGNA